MDSVPPESLDEDVKVCVDCPATVEAKGVGDTLVAIQTGWRLTRGPDIEGRINPINLQWRCPKCWAAYRRKKPAGR
jgi:hypothetical protein